MKALDLKTWSERQQVLAIIVVVALAMGGLWFFLMTPQRKKRAGLKREIRKVRAELVQKGLLLDKQALQARHRQAVAHNRALHAEWMKMARRIEAFPQTDPTQEPAAPVIEFKVRLIETRERLRRKGLERGIDLPYNLGMDEAVQSDQDQRRLMFQLRAVEKLADLALDLRIDKLKHLRPLPAVLHRTGERNEAFVEEFPIRMDFDGDMANLYDLFSAVLEEERVFVLKHVRVEAPLHGKPGLLNVSAVLSSLIFLKDPDDLAVAPVRASRPRRPGGH